MPRKPAYQEPQQASLSPEKMKHGIVRLEKLIIEIETFDTSVIQKRWGSEVKALEASIEGTLSSVFGHNTVEYRRYEGASHLDQGGVQIRGESEWIAARMGGHSHSQHDEARQAQQFVNEGKNRSILLLRKAIEWLQDELDSSGSAESTAEPASDLTDHIGIHPSIQEKCGMLYAANSYAEAVEKSFKIVRDRLRELTGHETGSEAFGKGALYVRGAAAPNVDHDFNEGAKFLMMAIDKFRNEKSHTSHAKITDPARAQQYLMLSSLAMHLLDEAEIRKL